MTKHKVEPGMKFGRFTVIQLSERRDSGSRNFFVCRCDCGKIKEVARYHLVSGGSKSCGCLKLEVDRKNKMIHGLLNHPLYTCWNSMHGRCRSKDPHVSVTYFDRGITVCDEWKSFKAFYDDMMPTWKPGLSIDRINNYLGYSKENCRWATATQQARNRRSNRMLEHKGETKTMSEWASIYKIDVRTVLERLSYGWNVSDALCKPIRQFCR